jgi:Ca2+-binding EF-hand superfamily protein
MSSVNTDNSLSVMLDKAFGKFDRNQDNKLDGEEYKSFYEVLRPGIAIGNDDKPTISGDEYFQRMDHDADGGVTRDEMQTTGVLMPADLCDESLDAMIAWLEQQSTTAAALAARYLAAEDVATEAQTRNT